MHASEMIMFLKSLTEDGTDPEVILHDHVRITRIVPGWSVNHPDQITPVLYLVEETDVTATLGPLR